MYISCYITRDIHVGRQYRAKYISHITTLYGLNTHPKIPIGAQPSLLKCLLNRNKQDLGLKLMNADSPSHFHTHTHTHTHSQTHTPPPHPRHTGGDISQNKVTSDHHDVVTGNQ